jgi:hypothetical protein
MNYINSRTALAFSIALVSFSAMADTPTTIGCKPSEIPANLSVRAEAWTNSECPLLEKKRPRRLLNKFGVGATFAYPFIPDTCLSGTIAEGTLQLDDGSEIEINPTESYTESAQRLFPVPDDQGGVNLFASSMDETLQAGAAMTALHLEGEDSQGVDYILDLLLDDHFLVTPTGEDTEDFLIVGSKGNFNVRGRLTGKGQIISAQPLGIIFEIAGPVCLR